MDFTESVKDSEIIDQKFISTENTCKTHGVTALGWEEGLAQMSSHLCGFPHSSSILCVPWCFHGNTLSQPWLLGNRGSIIFISVFLHLDTLGFLEMYVQLKILCN